MRGRMILWTAAGGFTLALALGGAVASAQVATTPTVPMELPVEVEIELAPAQSLKTVPLWKELIQLLRDPYSPAVRRPAFRQTGDPRGQTLLPLEVWPLDYNFLTAQPLRLRTNDGEVSWDQPGPLYDPAEDVGANEANFNAPQALRTPIGHVVACPNAPPYQAVVVPESVCSAAPAGGLVVYNDTGSDLIPPTGTVVAVAAIANGVLQEIAGTSTTVTEDVVELEIPVNEEDFLRPSTDVAGISPPLQPYVGRLGAEVLGKALFWDMQVGRDGVQSCGSCHFHAGADNRTRNQLNPNHIGGDLTFQVRQPNEDVVASDFPFHKLLDPTKAGEGDPANSVLRDANDVMSSMGVSRFKLFVDIPPIGTGAGQSFGPAVNGVRPLVPDLGTVAEDIITAADGFRRVEPRNTPTMHSAAFNFDNFWDGRARFHFNGGSVFGPSDPEPHIFINPGLAPNGNGEFTGATMGHLRPDLLEEDPDVAAQPVRIKFSSLASQAVGPPLSDFEMSFAGRNWQKIGKKLLQGNAGNVENIGNGAPQQALSNRANAVVPWRTSWWRWTTAGSVHSPTRVARCARRSAGRLPSGSPGSASPTRT